jgi:hypothetical protein
MSGILGAVPLLGTVHAALSCTNTASGQPICVGTTSSGTFTGVGLVLLVIYLAFLVIGIIAAVKVVTKAGYSGWWVLITLVPLVGFVFILIFAFSTWPMTRELELLRAQVHRGGGAGVPPGEFGALGTYGTGPGGGPGPDPLGPRPTSEVVAQDAVIPPIGQVLQSQFDPSGAARTEAVVEHPGAAPAEYLPTQAAAAEYPQAHPMSVQAPQAQAQYPQAHDPQPEVAPEPYMPAASTPEPTPVAQPVAGWYPSPGGPPGQLRYWDGTAWTEHLH